MKYFWSGKLIADELFHFSPLKDTIDPDLMAILMDILSNRSFIVDIDGNKSSPKNLKLCYVLGSILGPKHFNLYMKDVCTNRNGKHITI